jgi:dTDP-glucose 4,6-dehydratase
MLILKFLGKGKMGHRFLVIGSNSFSGSHFCKTLVERGLEVCAISRSPEAEYLFTPYRWREDTPRNFQFQQVDINKDLQSLKSILARFKPHYIVNFAAQSMVAPSWDNPHHWVNTNVLAVTNLISLLVKYDGLEKFVQVTTPEVYGSTFSKISEETPVAPSTPYAVSRAAGDMMLSVYQKQFGLPVSFTRAANVYGAGQQLYRIIPRTILSCLTGRRMILDGGGLSKRSFIHIDDVCSATLMIAEETGVGGAFHISTDEFVSIRSLVEKIVSMTGANFDEIVQVGMERIGKDQAYFLDSTKLRTKLGWVDSVTLEQGIERTIDWVRRNIQSLGHLEADYVHKP